MLEESGTDKRKKLLPTLDTLIGLALSSRPKWRVVRFQFFSATERILSN